MPEKSLKQKAVKGVAWTAMDSIAQYGIHFFVGLILARLLAPSDYGLIGIMAIFINLFNAIVDSGFTNALIRKKNANDRDYCTVFYINLVLSVILSVLFFNSAKFIAIFFNRIELYEITQAMSIIVIVNAFSIVQRARLTKALEFKIQTKISVFSSVISGIIGIIFAYSGYGVWALVVQQLIARALICLLLWWASKWIPRFDFSKESFIAMWTFGWKLLVSKIIDTTWNQMYQVVIGKCYSPQTLGLFTRAEQFSSLFSSNITAVVQRVSYPVLTSIQDDNNRLKLVYKRIIRTTMLLTCILMLMMAAIARSMVYVLIGEQWLPCVGFLQILCFTMMFYPLHAINLNMLQVQGRSDLFLRLEIIKEICLIIPIVLGIFIDIYIMLIGSFVFNVFAYYLNAYYSGPLINYGILEQVLDIFPSMMTAFSIALPVYLLSYLPFSLYWIFVLQLILGVTIGGIVLELSRNSDYYYLKNVIKTRFNATKQ